MPTDDLHARAGPTCCPAIPRSARTCSAATPNRTGATTPSHHLAEVLARIDELASGREDLYLVRLAAWFHDAVYAVPAGQVTNEEASARLAIRTLSRAGLEQEDLTQVARLVRMTETHVPGPATRRASCSATPTWPSWRPSRRRTTAMSSRSGRSTRRCRRSSSWPAGCGCCPLSPTASCSGRQKGRRLTGAARANLEREMQALIERLGPVEGSIP